MKKCLNNLIIGIKKILVIKYKLINIEIKFWWFFDKIFMIWEFGLFVFMICFINILKEKFYIVYIKI